MLPRVLSIAFTELFDAFATERRLLKNVVGRKVDFRGWSGVLASDFWNRPGMYPDFRSCCDVSIVRSTTDRRWFQFVWHQLAFVSSVICVKSNCDLRGGDTLTVELRRVLSGVLREPGKSDAFVSRGLSKAILAMQLRLKARYTVC